MTACGQGNNSACFTLKWSHITYSAAANVRETMLRSTCALAVTSVASRARDVGSQQQSSPYGKQVAAFFSEGGIINQHRALLEKKGRKGE